MAEDLPVPIPYTNTVRVNNNFLSIASDNQADIDDIGLCGKYISGGTKYAAFFREVATGIYFFSTTDTQPSTMVADPIAAPFECGTAYLERCNMYYLTPNVAITAGPSVLMSNTAAQTYSSYDTAYATSSLTAASTPNTWYKPSQFALTLAQGSAANFSLATATANTGLKYTGTKYAVAEIFLRITTTACQPYAAAIIANSPVAPSDTTTRAPNKAITSITSSNAMTALVNYVSQLDPGQEIGIFFAFAGTSFTINSIHLTVNILSWL